MKRLGVILALILSILLVILVLLLVLSFSRGGNIAPSTSNLGAVLEVNQSKIIKIGSTTISAETADTPAKQEQGLSGRPGLASSTGMLFVFKNEGYFSFWMKDMNFSLDMIWISADKRVVSITEDATPQSYPKTFAPNSPVQYVLEVPSGFARTNNIKIGDSVDF